MKYGSHTTSKRLRRITYDSSLLLMLDRIRDKGKTFRARIAPDDVPRFRVTKYVDKDKYAKNR